jgi:hypothetical protein
MVQSPNWAEITTAFATSFVALTGITALYLAWSQLRQAREQTKIQHLVQLERELSSEPLITYRCELAKKRLAGKAEPSELYSILDFFETVGLLVRRGYLDASDVWSTFGYTIIILFADNRELIRDLEQDDPTSYSDFRLLADRMRKIETAEGGTSEIPSAEEIQDFWRGEREVKAGTPIPKRKKTPARGRARQA